MRDKSPSDKDRLIHILEAIVSIFKFCENKSLADFKKDEILYDAVLYQFLVIGEAISNVDYNILSKYNYPWHLPRSFRNYIAHEYYGIKPERVWNTIQNELKNFLKIIQKMLKNEF